MRAVSGGPALVIPIKATLGAKQRLSSRLGSEERRMLALAMAGDTLRVAGRAIQRSRCVVVAGDAEVAPLAARRAGGAAPRPRGVGGEVVAEAARPAPRHEMAVVRERGAGQSAALRAGVA